MKNNKLKRILILPLCCLILLMSMINVLPLFSQNFINMDSVENALKTSTQSKKYTLIMVSDKRTNDVKTMEKILRQYQSKNRNKANLYNLDIKNAMDKGFIDKYQLATAPLPLLLTMAPGEVLTGGFPTKVTMEQLEQCTGLSQLLVDIMKSMQERKIALVCFQNNSTKFNKESDQAIKDFQKKEGYEGVIDVIKADPRKPENMDFLKQTKLKKDMNEAAVVFMMPPGRIVNTYTGKITMADLEASLSSCTGGDSCCPAPQP